MTTKKPDSKGSREPNFEQIAADIESILATGHPTGSNIHFDEVVLEGENAMYALDVIRVRLNGDYILVHVTDDTTYKEGVRHLGDVPLYEMGDKHILVLDTSYFEEFPDGVREAMQQHPNIKVLAVDQKRLYPHEPSLPYRVDTDRYLYETDHNQDTRLDEVL